MDSLAEEVVDAIDEISGAHPGTALGSREGHAAGGDLHGRPRSGRADHRRAHAGRPRAGDRARLQRRRRSSHPRLREGGPRPRGQVLPPRRRRRQTSSALTLPCFFVRTPEDFLAFTQARKDPERLMPAFLGAHPEALPAIQAALGADPPDSYATCLYNSIHSYRWTDARRDVALGALPLRARGRRGERRRADEARARGRDYLQEDCLARAELAFRMVVVIADEGDAVRRPDGCLARRARAHRGRPPGPRRVPTPSASATATSSCSTRRG